MNGIRRYNPNQLEIDGVLGKYLLGGATGLVAAAVTGELFQFRWPDNLRICAVRKIIVTAAASTLFGAAPATPLTFDIVKATAWTVQGTGGTVLDTTTGTGRKRTQMPVSLLTAGDCRIATTAALGAGTKTLDSQALATVVGIPVNGSNTMCVMDPTEIVKMEDAELDYPIVLAGNEGFVLRLTSNPGTGTLFVSVAVDWVETNAS